MFIDMRKKDLNGVKEEVMEVHQHQNTIISLNQIGNFMHSGMHSNL